MAVTIDRERVKRVLSEKSDAELLGILQRHDESEWQPEAFDVIRGVLDERGVPIPEVAQSDGSRIAIQTPGESRMDVWSRRAALLVCIAGFAVFTLGLVTQSRRLARDPMEDGILPGLVYCLLTGLGVLRSMRPQLPKAFHQASAITNALAAAGIVMMWVYLFRGAVDRGAELIPLLLTMLYLVMLRATMIEKYFRPPGWLLLVVLGTTAFFFIGQDLARADAPLDTLNRRADLLGGFVIATVLGWFVLIPVGLWRASRTIKE